MPEPGSGSIQNQDQGGSDPALAVRAEAIPTGEFTLTNLALTVYFEY
jgi:hypothetical protein